jgi:hypothetical protein
MYALPSLLPLVLKIAQAYKTTTAISRAQAKSDNKGLIKEALLVYYYISLP